ncbi:MAG: Fe(3+) ABC transporter substrate-binding protein [Thermincola sp.]|nr:Fe(3+) ABC transporter substrate-binding protein [Thermincola sp.]MDT3703010.1 Fe(3+) ABC transporter substrate-binding protein [Thermincola sp.]
MKIFRFRKLLTLGLSAMLLVAGCSSTTPEKTAENGSNSAEAKSQVVNLYTDRHYDSDDQLYTAFTAETGVKVNIVKGKSDELIERLKTEGADTEADLFITADVGRLHRAKATSLLQPIDSQTLNSNIPENLKDSENYWFGLTKRARVIIYDKDKVNPSELSTYEDLADSKWKGKILVRGSDSVYNQSLLASFIETMGEEKAKNWAAGIVANMARAPKGGDRDQAKAIAAGEGDIAIMNTYYFGQMLNSSDPEEKKVAEKLAIFFPDQNGDGTHINVSGAGVVKDAKNKENAVKLLEFLASDKAQKSFAEANYEYPVLKSVESSALLKSWGSFKEQSISLTKLGEHNERAVQILNEVGWK